MKTFLICLIVYTAGVSLSKETFQTIYSEKGVWFNKLEYVWKTNLISFLPIVNIIYPLILWRKGVYKNN